MPIAVSEEQLALQASIREWSRQAGTLGLVRRLEPVSSPGGDQGGLPGSAEGGLPGGGQTGLPGGPPGDVPWADCWSDLAGLGVFSIALPAEAGGAGGTVADLAAAVEQLTVSLVPGPVMPTLLAGLVLAGHPDLPAAKELLPALAAGQAPVAVGVSLGMMTAGAGVPAGLRRRHQPDPDVGGGRTGARPAQGGDALSGLHPR